MILGIYGSGGGGREVLELAQHINTVKTKWTEIIFIDDTKPDNILIRGHRVFSFEKITKIYNSNQIEIIISLGNPKSRKKLFEIIKNAGYKLTTLIHPNVYVPDNTRIGVGVIIGYNAFVSCDSVIDDNVMMQPMSGIGHDCHIGRNSVLSGRSCMGGYTIIGEDTYIALCVSIRDHTKIGNNVIVSIGSAVLKDIPDNVIAQGNPARPMLKNNSSIFHS